MNKEENKKIDLEVYIKPIYAFVLTKTKNLQDAEDLTQDIYIKIIKAIQLNKLIDNYDKYIWSIVHNSVKNYYRKHAVTIIGLDQVSFDLVSGEKSQEQLLIDSEIASNLHNKIAYLSSIQRKVVVMYYYSELKQTEIARRLNIPLNTIKWHLREAKVSLKKGIKSMNTNQLKFNPIKFDNVWFAGSVGPNASVNYHLKNILSQNIVYSIYESAKTINEIADCLNVSPVFIEDELRLLEALEFVLKDNDKYITNIIIEVNSKEKSDCLNTMYKSAASLVANDLFDALEKSDLLLNDDLHSPYDSNFLMWSLMPYILSNTGHHTLDGDITFDEVATLLADGSHFIATASIHNEEEPLPEYYDEIKNNYGPLWNGKNGLILWDMINKWVDRDINFDSYSDMINYDLGLLDKFIKNKDLSEDEYALLVQRGYCHRKNGKFELAIIQLKNKKIKDALFVIGDSIRSKHEKELSKLKNQYTDMILKNMPKHLRKKQEFVLQHIFGFDGWFILYCIEELVNTGRLKAPNETHRKSLIRLLINDL